MRITDFHNRSWKFKPCSSKTFPFFFWNSWKEKTKSRNMHLKKWLTYPKQRNMFYGRRHCRKQMGWLVTHDLVPKEHVPIMAGARLQQCDSSPAFSEFANNNHNPSNLILIDHNFSSKQRIPRNDRCISPRVFFFTNLTHWCFAKLLEVVHSAGPYELVRRFVLETKYTPMSFVYTNQYIHFNLYTIYIYRK